MIRAFPERLFKDPTFFIEDLPLYRRPYLFSWVEKKRMDPFSRMKISDLIELEFDPTRLREFQHENTGFIFERISPSYLPSIKKLRTLLEKISGYRSNLNFRNTFISINPPLAVFRDRGNGYILRRKVGGIHSDEALDQLRTAPHLKELNQAIGIDQALLLTVHEVNKRLQKTVSLDVSREGEDLTFFVPWDLGKNIPKIMVHVSDVSFGNLWIS